MNRDTCITKMNISSLYNVMPIDANFLFWLTMYRNWSNIHGMFEQVMDHAVLKPTKIYLTLFPVMQAGTRSKYSPYYFCLADWLAIQHIAVWFNGALNKYTDGLTHWGPDKIDPILKTTFSNAISWMKILEFSLKFHWSFFPQGPINNIPAMVQIMAWRWPGDSHYLNQRWLDYWRIYASLGLNELMRKKCNSIANTLNMHNWSYVFFVIKALKWTMSVISG